MILQKKLLPTAIKYGLISTILFIIVFVGMYILDINPLLSISDLDFLLVPIFVFFCLLEFRSLNHGILEYAQGMTIGMIMLVALALLSSLFIIIFHFVVDQDVVRDSLTEQLQLLDENKARLLEELSEADFLVAREKLSGANVWSLALDNFLKKTAVGFLLTVMISIILRKSSKKKNG